MPEIILTPSHIERSVEPTLMAPDMARVLQHVDPTFLAGRLRRGAGFARTRVPSSSTTVTNVDIIERYDGNRMIIDCNTDGTVRLIVGEGTAGCGRTVVEWGDPDDFGGSTAADIFQENFNEETDAITDPETGGY
jgi:hypothetical protein